MFFRCKIYACAVNTNAPTQAELRDDSKMIVYWYLVCQKRIQFRKLDLRSRCALIMRVNLCKELRDKINDLID